MVEYFIGLIPVLIIGYLLNIFIYKTSLDEKIEKRITDFDNRNSGPVYDFFKAILLILIVILVFFSLGTLIIPIYIYYAFSDGNILYGVLLTLITVFAMTFDAIVLEKFN